MNGVNKRIGIEIAMNSVCSSVIAMVKATAPVAPINNERNDPTHVWHAMNKPVVARILPSPPVFFVTELHLLPAQCLLQLNMIQQSVIVN